MVEHIHEDVQAKWGSAILLVKWMHLEEPGTKLSLPKNRRLRWASHCEVPAAVEQTAIANKVLFRGRYMDLAVLRSKWQALLVAACTGSTMVHYEG